jgi:hypothetical protein
MANNTIALLAKVPEFDTPLESQAKAMQIRNLMHQGQVQDMDMQQKRQTIERGNSLRTLMSGFTPETTTDDQVSALTRAGHLTEARSVAESAAKVSTDKRAAEKAELESHFKKYELVGQIMGAVRDQVTYDQARAEMAQIFPDKAAQMPTVYDPAQIEKNRGQAMGVKEQLEQTWKQKGFDREVAKDAESARHNRAQEGLTVRSQNMVDARSRESRADSLSKPFEVTGPDGVPVLVQQSKAGIVPVEGYTPKRAPQKPVPPGVVKTLTEARDNALTMDRLNTEFKPEYGGKGVFGLGADMSMAVKGNTGFDQKSVAFWKDYRKNAELTERHAMFGASLTPGEQASWRSADVAPGMDPEVIKTNLATRAALSKKVAEAAADDMVDAGHNEARVRAIAGRGKKPAAPTQVTNAADYAKVPSGAEFITPDGETRRKP